MTEQETLTIMQRHIDDAMQMLIEKCSSSRFACVLWETLEEAHAMLECEMARLKASER